MDNESVYIRYYRSTLKDEVPYVYLVKNLVTAGDVLHVYNQLRTHFTLHTDRYFRFSELRTTLNKLGVQECLVDAKDLKP